MADVKEPRATHRLRPTEDNCWGTDALHACLLNPDKRWPWPRQVMLTTPDWMIYLLPDGDEYMASERIEGVPTRFVARRVDGDLVVEVWDR